MPSYCLACRKPPVGPSVSIPYAGAGPKARSKYLDDKGSRVPADRVRFWRKRFIESCGIINVHEYMEDQHLRVCISHLDPRYWDTENKRPVMCKQDPSQSCVMPKHKAQPIQPTRVYAAVEDAESAILSKLQGDKKAMEQFRMLMGRMKTAHADRSSLERNIVDGKNIRKELETN